MSKKSNSSILSFIFKFIATLVILVIAFIIFYFTIGAEMIADYLISSKNQPEIISQVTKEAPAITSKAIKVMKRNGVTSEELTNAINEMSYSDAKKISDNLNESKIKTREQFIDSIISVIDSEKYNTAGMKRGLNLLISTNDFKMISEGVKNVQGPQLYAAFPLLKETILKSIQNYKKNN